MSGAGQAKSFDTVFVNLGAVNCPETSSTQVSDIVRGKIDRIKNCDLTSERSTSKAIEKNNLKRACYDRACALRIASILKADRVVYGTVRIATTTYNRQVGKEGAGKYLLQEKALESYVITLYLVDVKMSTLVAAVTETAGINTVPRDTERLITKFQPYFIPAGDTGRIEPAKKGEPAIPGAPLKTAWDLFAGPSGFIPVGSYNSVARAGVGFIAGGGVSNLAIKNSLLRFQMAYYYVFPKKKNIETYHIIPLTLLIGYTIDLPKGFSISPILGGGYMIHIMSEDIGKFRIQGLYRYSDYRYYDPHLAIRCDAAWRFNDHYAIFVTPEYLVFFEKSSTGMMVDFTAGFRYTF